MVGVSIRRQSVGIALGEYFPQANKPPAPAPPPPANQSHNADLRPPSPPTSARHKDLAKLTISRSVPASPVSIIVPDRLHVEKGSRRTMWQPSQSCVAPVRRPSPA